MLFSKTTGYGIRALVYLARQEDSRLCGLQEIAEEENIPTAYLGKILGDLRRHNILRSVKGIHGGYELARPADAITIWDIYRVLDPVIDFNSCILGLSECGDSDPCVLHTAWAPLKEKIVHLLKIKTIAEIAYGNGAQTVAGENEKPE